MRRRTGEEEEEEADTELKTKTPHVNVGNKVLINMCDLFFISKVLSCRILRHFFCWVGGCVDCGTPFSCIEGFGRMSQFEKNSSSYVH